ncbi:MULTISPECIES: PH domain-containing protein [Haloferax]|uniref:PH domain-containing protein n=2 Tax=Haloferax TaxID=2251 RepID=A0A6G1Z5L1_9EURY|nr:MULTISPECIES: PH domain-containing protein [Haloferax]KAB1188984.1 PH domain-containing protein [Haloferax sp. CBA1149]MRW81708.1 PH domain-containing protein [Haloferax marinisediminis]
MTHLSPLSVPYRAAQRSVSIVFALVFIAFTGGTAFGGFLGGLGAVALVGFAVLAIAGYEFAYFQRFEYELTTDTLDIRSGVFSRRNREIPYRRIQNVDISRNVAQRLVGLAAVDLETAGGGGTEGSLRFVTYEEALRIQKEVARLKRGDTAPDAPEPDREVLFELTPRELSIVGVLSFDLRLPGIIFLFGTSIFPVVASFVDVPVPTRGIAAGVVGLVMLALLVAVISWVAGFASAVVNYYGFRLTRVGDELQYERGLIQHYTGSIPIDKLQTLTIEDNPLKRRFGYATLLVETAGYTPGAENGGGGNRARRGSEAAIPLAKRDRVRALVEEIEGVAEPAFERPPRRIRRRYVIRYLLATGALVGALYGVNVVFGGIPWYSPLVLVPVAAVAGVYQWRHRGYALTENHFVTRNGFWKREMRFVPYYRIQTAIETRTIFQRRWRVSTVTADTAGSLSIVGGDAAAVDIEDGDAATLRTELSDRLRDALADRREERRRARQAALGIDVAEPDAERGVADAVVTAEDGHSASESLEEVGPRAEAPSGREAETAPDEAETSSESSSNDVPDEPTAEEEESSWDDTSPGGDESDEEQDDERNGFIWGDPTSTAADEDDADTDEGESADER